MAGLPVASSGLKSGSTLANRAGTLSVGSASGGLRKAASTVASGQGPGDSRRLAVKTAGAGAGKVAHYNRQGGLREKIRNRKRHGKPATHVDTEG